MKRPRISVVAITSRDDHPFCNRELHCLDPVTKTLAKQTFHDFELVVVDALYEQRRKWFKQHPQPFPVKHVPASPNHWHTVKRSGACAQINRGIVWADGDMVWIGCENNLFPAWFLEVAWGVFEMGLMPAAWHMRCSSTPFEKQAPSPTRFDLLGYTDKNVVGVDHRAEVFLSKSTRAIVPISHQNFYNHAGVPREVCLDANGYDEAFDGDLRLSDCDFGSRLEMLGHGGQMRLHRDLFVVKNGGGQDYKQHLGIKCNYALYLYNREAKRARGNLPLSTEDIELIRETICGQTCSIRERCKSDPSAGEHHLYPLYGDGSSDLVQHWLNRPVGLDLSVEVERRKQRVVPYDRATVT